MSRLEVGDLFVVIGCCPKCGNGQRNIGKVDSALRIAESRHNCGHCKAAFESKLVWGSDIETCWPEFAVRKIEPLRKEDEVLSEEKIPC